MSQAADRLDFLRQLKQEKVRDLQIVIVLNQEQLPSWLCEAIAPQITDLLKTLLDSVGSTLSNQATIELDSEIAVATALLASLQDKRKQLPPALITLKP